MISKIMKDKKEERTLLSDDRTKQQKANKSLTATRRVEPEGGADPLIKEDRKKATVGKEEERTPSPQKANKSSIRVMGSEDTDPNNGPEWC